MIAAFWKALGQIFDGAIVRYLGFSVLLAVATFAALFAGVWFLLNHTALFEIGWLETTVDILGGFATVVLALLLFPAVFGAMLGLFLEGVAAAVERRHYPDLPPAKGLGFVRGLLYALRFLLLVIALNLVLLLVLIVPPAYPVAFYLVNGYLLGREYFELVALRRLPLDAARLLRKQNGTPVFLTGVATAFLLTVPLFNLLVPVLATMAMVHQFEGWRRPARQRHPQ